MTKRELGAHLIGLNTNRNELVRTLIELGSVHNMKDDEATRSCDNSSGSCMSSPESCDKNVAANESYRCDKKRETAIMKYEARELLKGADDMHNNIRECLDLLLFEH